MGDQIGQFLLAAAMDEAYKIKSRHGTSPRGSQRGVMTPEKAPPRLAAQLAESGVIRLLRGAVGHGLYHAG